jgi:hypothetical protein
MTQKIAASLVPLGQVHSSGSAGAGELQPVQGVQLHTFVGSRWQLLVQTLKLALRLRPKLWLIHTPELLLPSLLLRLLGSTIVYDVQENYQLNILATNRPLLLRKLLASAVSAVERFSSLWVQQHFVAEKVYVQQLNWLKNPLYLPNTSLPIEDDSRNSFKISVPLRACITGTLSRKFGAVDALPYLVELHRQQVIDAVFITGHVPEQEVEQVLLSFAGHYDWVKLHISSAPLPHRQLLATLQEANLCLMPYQLTESVQGCIPTKLYECLSLRVPMLLPAAAPDWLALAGDAALATDFTAADLPVEVARVKQQLRKNSFYATAPTADIYWRGEQLREVVERLL